MDVDGLGSKLIEQLVDRGLVQSIADLYRLDIALLGSLERMGSKSAENLIQALDASRSQGWAKQLYGLGIHHVGDVNAKAITAAFANADDLNQAAVSRTRQHHHNFWCRQRNCPKLAAVVFQPCQSAATR